jgi:hypothetical protein
MSGGHFLGNSYIYYRVEQFADELENEIQNNNHPDEYGYVRDFNKETIDYLQSQIPHLRKMAEIMRAMDYLYSGDHGEDSFFRKIKEIEK